MAWPGPRYLTWPLSTSSRFRVMEAQDYSAQEYIGCISDEEVRNRILSHNEGRTVEPDDPSNFYPEARQLQAWRQHFKPECICRRLHDECYLSSGPNRVHEKSVVRSETQGQQKPDLLTGVTTQQLQDAAKAGCWFCSVVREGMRPARASLEAAGLSGDALSKIHVKAEMPSRENIGRPLLRVALFSSLKPMHKALRCEFYIQDGQDPGRICACFRAAPEIPISTALPESFFFAEYQLAKCMKNATNSHRHCEAGEVDMPTRILDITAVDGKYQVRLLITNGLTGKFVALSHCWGSTKHTTVTAENLSEMQLGIPWASLSRSFRDAIHITHRLGYRYLWIDALCILQDDSGDWQRESGRMNLVYQNCALMISADKAHDGDGGCFTKPTHSTPWVVHSSPQDMKIAVRMAKSHQGIFGPNRTGYSSLDAPLAARAWAFQERTLARRTLHFTADELVWECGAMYVCQCGDFHSVSIGKTAAKFIFQSCGLDDFVDHIWLGLVADYSSRCLTYPGDRLPGFSGLAKQYKLTWMELIERRRKQIASEQIANNVPQPAGNSTAGGRSKKASGWGSSLPRDLGSYVAGLWSNYLNVMLPWARWSPNLPLAAKPAEYIAPSWSWASINSQIMYTSQRQKMLNISIKDVSCTPCGVDPTGAVTAGYLLLSAPSIILLLSNRNQSFPDALGGSYDVCDYAKQDVSRNYMPDYLLPIEGKGMESAGATLRVYGIIMSSDFVMVVKRLGDVDAYERIGSLTFGLWDFEEQPAGWSRDAVEMTMKIV